MISAKRRGLCLSGPRWSVAGRSSDRRRQPPCMVAGKSNLAQKFAIRTPKCLKLCHTTTIDATEWKQRKKGDLLRLDRCLRSSENQLEARFAVERNCDSSCSRCACQKQRREEKGGLNSCAGDATARR
ncbi:hypothetical protein JCGZ_10821 [Jatropha curcas]|uniref:Uncharacterized protein n=1 Tax=Jatropha curcas TaxID=180498 RepID=A0A067KKA0_JATCU|nr:hypothetical protein JCGZ_10821 [Jatropha curcas]